MADILTKSDLVRGKANFEALDQFMSADASTSISLPGGNSCPSLKKSVKAIKDAFPADGAGLRSIGTNIGEVPIFTGNGLGKLGWGASTCLSVMEAGDGSAEGLSISGLYRTTPDDAANVGSPIASYGIIENLRYIGNANVQRFNAVVQSSPRFFARSSASGNYTNWVEFYHSGNTTPYKTTTAMSANVVVTPTGELQRSTSSKVFKKDIKDIELANYREALNNFRPVSYRSVEGTADNTDWSWYSFIAEELAEHDQRLVQMSNIEFFQDHDDDGNRFINYRELPEGEYAPNGLNIQSIVALQTSIMQGLLADLETAETKLAALEKEKTAMKSAYTKFKNDVEARLTALEAPAK